MTDGLPDEARTALSALEQQLAEMGSGDTEAFEVLGRLAQAVFPDRRIGDAPVLWPEADRPPGVAAGSPGLATAAGGGRHAPSGESGESGPVGPSAYGSPAGRQDLEAHIRQSEARFRSLVEQLPAVVFYAALGAGENEVYVSPQIETLLGFTQQEWLTNPLLWYSQLHPDDHDAVIDAFTKGVQTGQPFRAEVRFFSRSGGEVWILGEARLIRDELGRPAYFQGVAFDVTLTKRAQTTMAEAQRAKERVKIDAAQMRADAIATHNARLRQLNKQLLAAKDAAEAAANARTTFLTTMSHELRTPLNSVIVLAGLLAESELTPAQSDMVRRMRLSSDLLLALINDVLEFSRLRAGQVELERKPVDLARWLDDTIEIIAPRAGEKGLELRCTVADGIPRTLWSDEGRLRQILLNLLGNAVKFTSEGFVEVRVDATEVAPQRWEYRCAVRDSGMGIRPEDAATLFDEFRQADSGIAREFGGTGLGLAICKRLSELLGGRIWVAEADGPGATVTFTWVADVDPASAPPAPRNDGPGVVVEIPAPPAPRNDSPGVVVEIPAPWRPPIAAVAARQPDPSGPRARPLSGTRPGRPGPARSDLRVLVAEDNVMNQQVATLLLAAMGHGADVVGNGDQAIAAVRSAPYDVVLMDVAMPGTDGVSATRVIRRLGAEVHQPYIVALTAHAFPGDSESCLDAGMDDYVAKPIDRAELARALAAGAARRDGPSAAGRYEAPAAGWDGAPAAALDGPPPPSPTAAAEVRLGPLPDLDPSMAAGLVAEFGPEALGRLVTIFRTEASRLVDSACAAIAAGDAKGAEAAAHTLKSSAANLGAVALAASCSALEATTRTGSLADADALAAAMVAHLAGALRGLDEVVAPQP
ncbi:MAG TPA: ATP-binding protein [Acidimicrobiales bacterium]|nr:ATP-binding protein [Acidimicrobiales bacterium]